MSWQRTQRNKGNSGYNLGRQSEGQLKETNLVPSFTSPLVGILRKAEDFGETATLRKITGRGAGI